MDENELTHPDQLVEGQEYTCVSFEHDSVQRQHVAKRKHGVFIFMDVKGSKITIHLRTEDKHTEEIPWKDSTSWQSL